MSSPTDNAYSEDRSVNARKAAARMGMARWLAYAALLVATGLTVAFTVQLGLFDRPPPKPAETLAPVELPNQITGGPSRILGFDKHQLPFEITAQKGVQDAQTDTVVHLEQVVSAFQRPSGAKLNITSQTAVYETKTKALELVGDVLFAEGERFRARMSKAAVNMDDQTLTSKSPVSVDIIGGNITADSLTISEDGNRILFKGGVKARFVTKKTE